MTGQYYVELIDKTRDEFNATCHWCYERWGDPSVDSIAKKYGGYQVHLL